MGLFGGKKDKQKFAKDFIASSTLPGSPDQGPTSSYVAPEPTIGPNISPRSQDYTNSNDRPVDEDEEMVVVDKKQDAGSYEDEEEPAPDSYSRAEDTIPDPALYEHKRMKMKQNHLNSLFNGHLMKWKYEAEEGTPFIRVPAFLGALAMIVTVVLTMILYPEAWEPHSIVITVLVVILSFFIIILEGRFIASSPLSARAHLRNIMTRNFNIFRFLWGRGILYIVTGALTVTQIWLMTIISGAFMILLGFLAICVGGHASRKFSTLRNSLSDESYLLLTFSYYDSDGDGFLVPYEFANLLHNLGMELDDRYNLKAFNAIDTDGDRKISFEEFCDWWNAGYIERGRRYNNHASAEGNYDDLSRCS